MSKTALKKALASMTPEQMAELVLDLYSARPEAKEYLDFFLDPDIDRLVDKTTADIVKEVNRKGRRGYCKPRITLIRGMIKKVDTLGAGKEYTIRLKLNTLHAAAQTAASGTWFSEGYIASFCRLLGEAVREADNAGILAPTVNEIEGIVCAMPGGIFNRASRTLRNAFKEALAEAVAAVASQS